MDEWDLDIFGQRPGLSRLYTQLCFCFPLLHSSRQSQSAVVELLTSGLERLSESFPWVAGQVVGSSSGVSKIQSSEMLPCLTVKDLREALPTYIQYREARFPFSLLDETIIAQCKTLPEKGNEPAPVFLVQANFISGGLLLVFTAQHNCMDMVGQGQIIRLFSKACRRISFSAEEQETGNLPRRDIIPLLNTDERENAKPDEQNEQPARPAPSNRLKAIWAYFIFSATALADLKLLAIESVHTGYVSTDDVLSAFIWQAVTRARLHRLTHPMEALSTFSRQVDARSHLNLPATYPGVVVQKTSNSVTVEELLNEPLGVVASQLRSSLTQDLGYKARLAATKFHLTPASNVSRGGTSSLDLSTDIVMSSWAKEKCYELDFGGLLGKAEAVRRPQFEAWESLGYFMPKRLDGEIAVALCLRKEDMERLKVDSRFTGYCCMSDELGVPGQS